MQMKTSQLFNRPARIGNAQGFTLIELMVVVAIVGILASVAYPSFMSQVRKSRRSDAVVAMSGVQQAQESWRANKSSYITTTSLLTTAAPDGLGFRTTGLSESGYYSLSLSPNTATAIPPCTTESCYIVTATAVPGKSQASDTNCTSLVITVTNGSGVKTPDACWSK
jgi:type IV pilus assembly protein PilE